MIVRQIPSDGIAVLQTGADGADGVQNLEFDSALAGLDSTETNLAKLFASGGRMINRSIAKTVGAGTPAESGKKAKSNPELAVSFGGLNFRQQRLANGGNQFSVEPPDQALCVGNGYVLEAVNDVLRVFDGAGNALSGVVDLNTFYGYPAAINRANGKRGPSVTDPVCHYDADTQRFFVVVLTLDHVGTTAQLSGKNHLDIAVSTSANPLGAWKVYRLPVQDDGSDGTPVHANCPCLGDYPHIGADANGLYLTTNEFPFFVDGFNGAQIYAFSKRALASGAASVNVVQFDTAGYPLQPDGTPGFTVWPAISPGTTSFAADLNGTEYFLSSQAVFNDDIGADNRLRLWALTNTASLDSASPAMALTHGVVSTNTYAVPPKSDQKAGDAPLRDCINDTSLATPFGPGCWQFLLNPPEPAHDEVLSHPDSNDSRMQQVSYANGKLWGALDTAVNVGGQRRAGIAYFVIKPRVDASGVSGKIVIQGTLALANNNLTYPSIAVLPNGRGVMGFTVMGQDHFPSAGYAGLDALVGAGDIHIAAAGAGPDDGFTGYKAFVGNPPRTRWGDYGAAATDGNSIWLAAEYIAQTCTFAQYVSAPFGSCGSTRASLGNWATLITKVTP